MNNEQTVLLAKLMVGIAWADMDVHPLEKETVDYLISSSDDISHTDRLAIRLYYEYPLAPNEVATLIKRMKKAFSDESSVQSAMLWIKKIIKADGVVDEHEREIYDEVLKSLKSGSSESRTRGLTRFLTRNAPMSQHDDTEDLVGLGREKHLEDYINNPLYFKVYQAMTHGEEGFGLIEFDKEDLRKICLATTLIVRVIQADDDVSTEELQESVNLLNCWMDVPEELARKLIDKALIIDESLINVSRLCRRLCKRTTLTQRKQFLEILMTIANVDNDFQEDEVTNIWAIAKHLELPESALKKLRGVLSEMNDSVQLGG